MTVTLVKAVSRRTIAERLSKVFSTDHKFIDLADVHWLEKRLKYVVA